MSGARGLPAANAMSRSGGGGGKRPRAETATLLARLERQRSMLEKQLQVWRHQKQKTEERLASVEAQIQAVCESLTLADGPSPVPRARRETSSQTSQRPAFNYRY